MRTMGPSGCWWAAMRSRYSVQAKPLRPPLLWSVCRLGRRSGGSLRQAGSSTRPATEKRRRERPRARMTGVDPPLPPVCGRRRHREAGLVLEDDPSPERRHGGSRCGHTSFTQPATTASSLDGTKGRNLMAPATAPQHPGDPRQRHGRVEPSADQRLDPGERPPLVRPSVSNRPLGQLLLEQRGGGHGALVRGSDVDRAPRAVQALPLHGQQQQTVLEQRHPGTRLVVAEAGGDQTARRPHQVDARPCRTGSPRPRPRTTPAPARSPVRARPRSPDGSPHPRTPTEGRSSAAAGTRSPHP